MIIFTHHTGEPYAVLGAQVAATFFQRNLSLPSIVVGIERDFSKERLLGFVDEYYAKSGALPQRLRHLPNAPAGNCLRLTSRRAVQWF